MSAGAAAGCKTLLVEHKGSVHKRLHGYELGLTAVDLARGAWLLLQA
jgi:hypothetical protein